MRRIHLLAAVTAVALLVTGTAVAQSVQRFTDVRDDHPAQDAIVWAADVGLTTGYSDGTFQPEQPLSKQHAVISVERYYDQILGVNQSADFTRADMMLVLHNMAHGTLGGPPDDSEEAADSGPLFGDAFDSIEVPVSSIHKVRIGDWTEFRFQAVSTHTNRDPSKHPVRGWMTLICSKSAEQPGEDAWFVNINIQGDASLPAHFEGLNVSLDGGQVHGIATKVHGHIANKDWLVINADAFVSWIAPGNSLSATTRFQGEGATFDVSEMKLYRHLVPDRCRW